MKRMISGGVLVLFVFFLATPLLAAAEPAAQTEGVGPSLILGFVIVAAVILLMVGRQVLSKPGKPAALEPGQQRNYGVAGGAVCRGCGLPFARSVMDINMLTGKLVRCPHCGKWGVLPAASPLELRAAEERERLKYGYAGATAAAAPLTEEEKLRRTIENSKYE